MKSYLSIDCGGTKTAFLLCGENGEIEASCLLGPGNYLVDGLEAVLKVLREGIEQICKQSGQKHQGIVRTFIAIAGFGDIPNDMDRVRQRVCSEFPGMNITIGNDTENALAGSLTGKCGIHVIAGTGSIGLGLDEKRNYIRSGGWHHLFGGDEGSAYWIGCRLLWHFTRQADGREKKSILYSWMMEKYRLECPENVLDLVLNQWKGERSRIAGLSVDVFELAEKGDQNAIIIFEEAGRELAAIARSIYERGDFRPPVPISYSGGVFRALKYMENSLEEELLSVPHMLMPPQLLPIGGGILLACEKDGKKPDNEMLEKLRLAEKCFSH